MNSTTANRATTDAQPPKPALTREYWTYKVGEVTGPVAQFRMAQLIDYDRRLTDPARTVYRFLIGWYMHSRGDALASVRHIVTTMRGRAPDGARHLSRSAVQRAVVLLIDCGWLVRTHVGKGRGGSRYVPVLNVLELASQGTLPQAEINSVPFYRDTTDVSLASHSTGTVLSHSTGTLAEIASRPTGTKTLLRNPSTDGVTERETDPAAPTAPPLADGLAATAAGGTAVEERCDIVPTFELCWRTYDYARGKKAAREAWKALPDEVDRAAVTQAAAAWREAWAAQGKPDAPRYTLSRWLKDERYDEDPPKGFTKVERGKAKSKSGKFQFGIGANIKHFTITSHETDGSPFADFWETFTFRADDGHEFTRRMHVVSAIGECGEGEDVELKRSLIVAAWGKGGAEGDYVGRVVGVTDAKGLCFFNVGQPTAEPEPWVGDVDRFAPFGTFSATFLDSAVDWNENGQFVTLMLEISNTPGGTEITRQINHTFDMETIRGRAFLASICRAVGIAAIEDTEVLHGKALECTITDRGEISYAPLMAKAA